mgnify:CR=1 FL=1
MSPTLNTPSPSAVGVPTASNSTEWTLCRSGVLCRRDGRKVGLSFMVNKRSIAGPQAFTKIAIQPPPRWLLRVKSGPVRSVTYGISGRSPALSEQPLEGSNGDFLAGGLEGFAHEEEARRPWSVTVRG